MSPGQTLRDKVWFCFHCYQSGEDSPVCPNPEEQHSPSSWGMLPELRALGVDQESLCSSVHDGFPIVFPRKKQSAQARTASCRNVPNESCQMRVHLQLLVLMKGSIPYKCTLIFSLQCCVQLPMLSSPRVNLPPCGTEFKQQAEFIGRGVCFQVNFWPSIMCDFVRLRMFPGFVGCALFTNKRFLCHGCLTCKPCQPSGEFWHQNPRLWEMSSRCLWQDQLLISGTTAKCCLTFHGISWSKQFSMWYLQC